MSILDRIKAHQSAPDVYDPPSLDALMKVALAADELAKASFYYKDFVLDHTGNSEVVPVFTEPLQRLDLALAAFRAACGEGE